MRRFLAVAALLALLLCSLIPSVSFTEDRDAILLARVIYALGKSEDYQTRLALGTVVMNRMEHPWFPGSLGEVLRDQQQFPAGSRYDDDSLRAAHELIGGRRALGKSALYYQSADASAPWSDAYLVARSGNYNFYSADGNI